MKTFRFILVVIIFCSLGAITVISWRTVGPPAQKTVPPEKPSNPADLMLDRLRYTETKEGVKEWELEAASALYFKDKGTVVFEKVKATFFGKNQGIYVLVGEKGKFNPQTKAIEVFDGVKLDSSDGYHMRTQSLKYEAEKRELSTPDPIEMSGPQLRVEGTGLIVELDRQRLKVLRHVRTTLSPVAMKDSWGSTW